MLAELVLLVAILPYSVLQAGPAPGLSLLSVPLLPSVSFIVTGPTLEAARAAVLPYAPVRDQLPLINGVVVNVPVSVAGVLNLLPGIVASLNTAAAFAEVAGTAHAPSAVFPHVTGASLLAATGTRGTGVTVAVVDTGIAALPDFAGRLLDGVDLSGEGNAHRDSYGHGTFVGGLIAGDGASSLGMFTGEAPGARLVPIKVAGASGRVDMATVIKGIQWAVAHRQTIGIDVLNLSLGALPAESTFRNPLDRAAEKAWNAGIVVVASAGNAGPFNGTVTAPGDDPLIITVGAVDDMATVTSTDDTMTSFSSVGPTSVDGWLKVDLVAPGRSVVSLRSPGSTIDTSNPSARVGAANLVGSGTSFSAAITSGAAALVMQANVAATPDEVKGRLLATAAPGPIGNPFVDGHGALDVYSAATASGISFDQRNARGGSAVAPGSTVALDQSWAASSWDGRSWNGSTWNGRSWNGSAWDGRSWNGSAWDGRSWNRSSWS